MDRASCTVFIGNIPYDATEQVLQELFAQAGPIKSLRMVTDKDTGKAKGYGFCEYHDSQTAQSAVRNLNNYEVNGRKLRVDFAEEHSGDARGRRDKDSRGGDRGGDGRGPRGTSEHNLAPGLPPGTRPIGRETAATAATQANALLGNAPYTGPSQDKINTVIAGMTPMQLFEILSQMRGLCQQNQAAARSILVANPQLTKALFQAQVLLGMVKGSAPQPSAVVAAAAAMAPPPVQQAPPPMAPPAPVPMAPPAMPPPAPGQPPYGGPPAPGPYGGPPGPPPQGPMGGPAPMLIDPSTGMAYTAPPGAMILPAPGQPPPAQPPPMMPPPMMPPPPAAPDGGAPGSVTLPPNLAPQQAQVLQQVLSLTTAQIDALPPAQRQQVLLVRQQLGLTGPQ
ncbi:hypothetical protein HYH03_012152 [Edaphochlamys debaryana]|uniref:RRM domain-containing protein n=1 Tax=Edaphochlamys debaryana TaxID=47281 RepID=A0A835XYQ4_9CHLO|nr:hypothetical protein HYH03_012152 [Edaphochlamys debaryana]|eukprot:KAG2489320.1 hypothetical protein HYH03_012152 [Edaphochlamys debaryana]